MTVTTSNVRATLIVIFIAAVLTMNQWMMAAKTERSEDMKKVDARAYKMRHSPTIDAKHQEIKSYMKEARKEEIKERIRAGYYQHL